MRERLIYTNERGESVEFSTLSVFHTNITKDVSGLSDVESEVYTASSVNQDGATVVATRIESRAIEISGHLRSTDALAMLDLRRRLNRVLNPHYRGVLRYQLADQVREIDCRVVDASRFHRKKILDEFKVEFFCPSPYWHDVQETRTDIALWQGLMQFPLTITEDWQIGVRQPSRIVNVENCGDVTTGLIAEFRALGSAKNPSILHLEKRQQIKVMTDLKAGDILTVSTGWGDKKVLRTRENIVTNEFSKLSEDSSFIQLEAGDNLIRYDAESGAENLEITIVHSNQYLEV